MRLNAAFVVCCFATAWSAAGGVPVTAIDAAGETVALTEPAKRVVSLAPHATELLFAAGAGEQVVAVLGPSDAPPEAARLPRVGDARSLDLERIVALAPDLVVAWPYLAPGQVERLHSLGVPIYMSDPRTPQAIADDLEHLGALTGHARAAAAVAAGLRERIAALRARERAVARVRVFYEIWDEPLFTVGGAHLISAAIRWCGGENVFASLALPAPQVSVESVLAAAPDAIIAGADGPVPPAWLDAWSEWKNLPAVERGNLYAIDANLLHRAGPRFVDGLEGLCEVLDRARAKAQR